jgi:hypothetical protein
LRQCPYLRRTIRETQMRTESHMKEESLIEDSYSTVYNMYLYIITDINYGGNSRNPTERKQEGEDQRKEKINYLLLPSVGRSVSCNRTLLALDESRQKRGLSKCSFPIYVGQSGKNNHEQNDTGKKSCWLEILHISYICLQREMEVILEIRQNGNRVPTG